MQYSGRVRTPANNGSLWARFVSIYYIAPSHSNEVHSKEARDSEVRRRITMPSNAQLAANIDSHAVPVTIRRMDLYRQGMRPVNKSSNR